MKTISQLDSLDGYADPNATGAQGKSTMWDGFDKRKYYDGRVEYLGMVKASKWPAEGPRELWGLEYEVFSQQVVAIDRDLQRHLYEIQIFSQTRKTKDGSYLTGWWYALTYQGLYK